MPKDIDVEMQGEGLFNDGVAIVLFVVLVGFATQTKETTVAEVLITFVREVGGGLAIGVVTGFIAYWALRPIDEFTIEILVTLALVTATYAIAQRLGASGPLSVVAAGLIVGSRGRRYAMSDESEQYLSAVWTLIDQILNAVLFMLIGLEVLVLRDANYSIPLALITIPIVLLARLVALSIPVLVFRSARTLAILNVPFLTWAGIRGGVSVALALALPNGGAKYEILAATYAVVLFSIIIQSSTLGRVARITIGRGKSPEGQEERDPSEPEA
jgi:CPA1 family monovalent cation:H+ antiporter